MAGTGSPTARRLRKLAACGAGAVSVLGLAAALALPGASASVRTVTGSGDGATDGVCANDSGVTVVVDAKTLDAGVSVRCVPDAAGMSGLDALKAAGFSVTGTRRYGEAFVCRVDDRPSPTRTFAIPGNDSYRETCADTPPTTAMWAYFSGDDGTWTYSTSGAKSRTVEPGGFEGWSFTIDRPEGSSPPDFHPVHTGQAVASGSKPTATKQQPTNEEPAATAGQDDSGGAAPWIAGAAIVGLSGLAATVALRRRRAREDGP